MSYLRSHQAPPEEMSLPLNVHLPPTFSGTTSDQPNVIRNPLKFSLSFLNGGGLFLLAITCVWRLHWSVRRGTFFALVALLNNQFLSSMVPGT